MTMTNANKRQRPAEDREARRHLEPFEHWTGDDFKPIDEVEISDDGDDPAESGEVLKEAESLKEQLQYRSEQIKNVQQKLGDPALGGAARLMVDRAGNAVDDDGYDDGPGGEVVVRGVGSQAGVIGGGVDACNGRIFVVDRVLLPVDVDGVTTPEQKAHAEAIRRAIAAEADADAEAPAASESGN